MHNTCLNLMPCPSAPVVHARFVKRARLRLGYRWQLEGQQHETRGLPNYFLHAQFVRAARPTQSGNDRGQLKGDPIPCEELQPRLHKQRKGWQSAGTWSELFSQWGHKEGGHTRKGVRSSLLPFLNKTTGSVLKQNHGVSSNIPTIKPRGQF